MCNCLDQFSTPMILKPCYSSICNDSVQFQMEIRKKLSRRRSRSSDYARLGHSRSCFAEDSKEMYKDL